MPSISRGVSLFEKSIIAWLNFFNWSTASFPTSASPTNNTKSGSLMWTNCKQTNLEIGVGKFMIYIIAYHGKFTYCNVSNKYKFT